MSINKKPTNPAETKESLWALKLMIAVYAIIPLGVAVNLWFITTAMPISGTARANILIMLLGSGFVALCVNIITSSPRGKKLRNAIKLAAFLAAMAGAVYAVSTLLG